MIRHCCGMSLAWAICENQALLKVVRGFSLDSVLIRYKHSSFERAVKKWGEKKEQIPLHLPRALILQI